MSIYIFIPSHIGEALLIDKLPIQIDAPSDDEAREKTKGLGPGELFKKISRVSERKTLKKRTTKQNSS